MSPLSHLCIVCGAQHSGFAPGKCSIYSIYWIEFVSLTHSTFYKMLTDECTLTNCFLQTFSALMIFIRFSHCYLMPVSLVPAQRAQWTSCLLYQFAPHCPLRIPVSPTPAREIPAEVWASLVSSVLSVLFLILACSSSKQYQELWSITCKLTS